MPRSRSASKSADLKLVRSFLNDAFNDYLAARVLLLSRMPQQGSVLSSTAIEKYFKAILAFRGNESHGHLKSAHWKAVKNFAPQLFDSLDLHFLELNRRCYRLRYTDDIPVGFNLVVATREFLAELDHTALSVQRNFVFQENGAPVKFEFDSLFEKRDERLWDDNHVLLGGNKAQFIYLAPQFVYEMRHDAAAGLLEATYFAEGQPKESGFLRQGFVPKNAQGMSYEFAFGQSQETNG